MLRSGNDTRTINPTAVRAAMKARVPAQELKPVPCDTEPIVEIADALHRLHDLLVQRKQFLEEAEKL